MNWNFLFFTNSIMLGTGLAMDAFSVSLANGLNEPHMRSGRMCGIAGVFSFFQAAMPMIGWFCVRTIADRFEAFEVLIPWIALILLAYIGGKMLLEGIQHKNEEEVPPKPTDLPTLLLQGVATSIDALSVGFTISKYNWIMALICSLIIALVTFIICMCGLFLGKKFGTRLAGKANILGGIILIAIGLQIFISGIL